KLNATPPALVHRPIPQARIYRSLSALFLFSFLFSLSTLFLCIFSANFSYLAFSSFAARLDLIASIRALRSASFSSFSSFCFALIASSALRFSIFSSHEVDVPAFKRKAVLGVFHGFPAGNVSGSVLKVKTRCRADRSRASQGSLSVLGRSL